MVKLSELDWGDSSGQPIFAIVEVYMDGEETVFDAKDPHSAAIATAATTAAAGLNEREGISLLRHISSEKTESKLSKLVIPVAMIHHQRPATSTGSRAQHSGRLTRPSSGGQDKSSKSSYLGQRASGTTNSLFVDPHKMFRCLEAGATDVLSSPLVEARVSSLPLHAYRAHKEALKDRAALLAAKRLRKRSWVGFDDKRPHAYLREQMYVSGISDYAHMCKLTLETGYLGS